MKKTTGIILLTSIILNAVLLIVIGLSIIGNHEPAKSVPIEKLEKELVASYFPSSGVQEQYCSIYYDGRVYTSTIILDALETEEALGKKLGTVYGNKVHYWSLDEDNLFTSNMEGKLYELKGYDKDYRVGIVYEYGDGNKRLMVFECLNGIALNTGKDIFKERMGLSEYLSYDVILESEQTKIHSGSVDEHFMQEFLEELCGAELMLENDAIYSATNEAAAYELIFISENGIKERLHIYESGYAMYETTEEKLYFDAAYSIRRLLVYFEMGGNYTEEDFELTDVTDSKKARKSVGFKDNGGARIESLLYYNGGLYSTAGMIMSSNINELFEETIVDEPLGTVYGYHTIAWADEKEALFDCDLTGTVYSIRGYGEEERLGIIYEAYGTTRFMVFHRK